jgi:hypothetical protein
VALPARSREHLTRLLEFCNVPSQAKTIEAVIKHGGFRPAAKALGLNNTSVLRTIERAEIRAAKRGYAPDYDATHAVPEGQQLKGLSTYYDARGNVIGQWVKSMPDLERQKELMAEASAAFAETLPRAKPTNAPKPGNDDLLNLYVLTDYHLGMKAWHSEAGEDWDLSIAEDLLYRWIDDAIARSPEAHTGVFAQLGDLLHWDGLDAVTPTNRHILDADTRFQKVVRVAIRSMRRIIQRLLTKHAHLHIIMADANHDPASSVWLREWLASVYEDEPRITVDQSADTYYCVEHGATSLFFHHGHKRKPTNVDDVFAAKFREVFGRTKHSYAHMGHLHHIESKETNLMLVEQHRTLAAKDAYASRGGWMAGRDAKVITYHKAYGEVSRVTVTPEMVA